MELEQDGRSPIPPLSIHAESDHLRSALVRCERFVRTFSKTVYRAVAVKRANREDIFSGEGSRVHGGRWNPPGMFPTVYASMTINTATK